MALRPSPALSRLLARTHAPRLPSASPAEHIPACAKRLLHTPRTSRIAVRPCPSPFLSRAQPPRAVRFESTAAPSPPSASTSAPDSRLDRDQVPSYELTFTCNVCKTRSSHRLSKQGYHHGSVLISCPDCKNRHLISDHLKIFSDKSVTIEDLMREKGSLVKKGSLSADGDVEFWDDGSCTPRSAQFHPESKPKGDQRFVEQPASPKGKVG
ncbi:zf-DNL-domain-containing protein [Ophiobolus disseminans]|uniref:Zf-DNL-domain-containing protein n=1 Tax=Ophiobolus disseminans TaxID=1469910 RepID=A0A6A6ZHU8_9PLEO|nr:zf-DNL-domain-containing protein [Ophiobolus disseminans]